MGRSAGCKQRGMWRAATAVVLLGVAMLAARAQDATPAGGPAAAVPAAGGPIQLSVVVTDHAGKPVAGLQAGDFTVLDGKQVARIVGFRAPKVLEGVGATDASTEILLILDEVNAPFDRVTYARLQMEEFLRQNGGQLQHPVSLGLFTEQGLELQTEPSTDGKAMAAVLEKQGNAWRMMDRGTGFHGAEQRLKVSQDALRSLIQQEKGKPWRKMAIWVSGGWPLLAGPNVDVTDRQRGQIFDSIRRLNAGLAEARMTLYSIDSLGTGGEGAGEGGLGNRSMFYKNYLTPPQKPGQAEFAGLSLPVLVTQTGGRAIFGDATIQHSLNQVVNELAGTYVLSVELPVADAAAVFHPLAVRSDRGGLTLRTRVGYYVGVGK